MIWVYPHDADWDAIAAATGDDSWSAASMRRLFQKIENCRHRPVHRWLARLGIDGHGARLARVAARRARGAVGGPDRHAAAARRDPGRHWPRCARHRDSADRLRWFFTGWFDPNDQRLVRDNAMRHSLRAAHDRSAPSCRHARAIARRAGSVSRPPHHPARHAGHARAAGRRAAGVRRRVPARCAAVPGPRRAELGRRASWARRTPRARSSCRAARSTRRSC